ncbi:unnamed protein product, partial [Didymodactylos carnosus]
PSGTATGSVPPSTTPETVWPATPPGTRENSVTVEALLKDSRRV